MRLKQRLSAIETAMAFGADTYVDLSGLDAGQTVRLEEIRTRLTAGTAVSELPDEDLLLLASLPIRENKR